MTNALFVGSTELQKNVEKGKVSKVLYYHLNSFRNKSKR